jgi:hypothetical protein
VSERVIVWEWVREYWMQMLDSNLLGGEAFFVGSFSTVIAVCDVRVGVSACWIVSLLISDSDLHICTGVRWCVYVCVCAWLCARVLDAKIGFRFPWGRVNLSGLRSYRYHYL